MIEDFSYTKGSLFWIINNTFFQYYSLFIFIVCAIVMITVSYASEQPSYTKISGLTYGTITSEHKLESRSSWTTGDVISSLIVIVLIATAYIYFSG